MLVLVARRALSFFNKISLLSHLKSSVDLYSCTNLLLMQNSYPYALAKLDCVCVVTHVFCLFLLILLHVECFPKMD